MRVRRLGQSFATCESMDALDGDLVPGFGSGSFPVTARIVWNVGPDGKSAGFGPCCHFFSAAWPYSLHDSYAAPFENIMGDAPANMPGTVG